MHCQGQRTPSCNSSHLDLRLKDRHQCEDVRCGNGLNKLLLVLFCSKGTKLIATSVALSMFTFPYKQSASGYTPILKLHFDLAFSPLLHPFAFPFKIITKCLKNLPCHLLNEPKESEPR